MPTSAKAKKNQVAKKGVKLSARTAKSEKKKATGLSLAMVKALDLSKKSLIATGLFKKEEAGVQVGEIGNTKGNGKTQAKTSRERRSADTARSSSAGRSVSVRAANGNSGRSGKQSHGNKSKGHNARSSRASSRNGATRISKSDQTSQLILPHESAL